MFSGYSPATPQPVLSFFFLFKFNHTRSSTSLVFDKMFKDSLVEYNRFIFCDNSSAIPHGKNQTEPSKAVIVGLSVVPEFLIQSIMDLVPSDQGHD